MLQYNTLPFHFRNLLSSFIGVIVISTNVYSQNLVPNYSIENANCPTSYNGYPIGLETMIPDWYSVTCTSPDAFTGCSTNPWTQVPNNLFGNQTARTGTNYLGFGMYGGWYDYLGAKLTCRLKAGNTYQVSFWISRCDNARYAADEIGMYLSTTTTKMSCGFGNTVLTYIPQVKNPSGNYLTDQINWVEISGTYIASGGEQYITIGYFKPWSLTDFIDGGTSYSLTRSTYYVDDISITGIGDCPLSLDTTHMIYKQPDYINSEKIEYLYLSESSTISFRNASTINKVFIHDINGSTFLLNKINQNDFTIPFITRGLYILTIETDKKIIREKIIFME